MKVKRILLENSSKVSTVDRQIDVLEEQKSTKKGLTKIKSKLIKHCQLYIFD